VREIAGKVLEAKHQRRVVPVEPEILDDRAPGEDMRRQPAAGKADALDRFAILQPPEDFISATHASLSFTARPVPRGNLLQFRSIRNRKVILFGRPAQKDFW
jgi:hypothetical protein